MKALVILGVISAVLSTGCATTEQGLVARQQALIERQQRTISDLLEVDRQQLRMLKGVLIQDVVNAARPYPYVPLER